MRLIITLLVLSASLVQAQGQLKGSSLNLGPSGTSGGVLFTPSNGTITLAGLGNGTDENLTVNLNASNVITLSSSTGAVAINASGLALSSTLGVTAFSGTAVPAGGTAGSGFKFSSTANLGVFFGSGVPTLSAAQGSLYLRTDGAPYYNTNGTTGWNVLGAGSGTPGGSDTHIQYNDGGSFGGEAGFTYDKTTNTATIPNLVVTGDATLGAIADNSIALGTKTTGNYAAGDAEAGAALTGDTATAFFSAGTIEDARLPTTQDGKTLTGVVNVTLAENASVALDPALSADGKYSGTTIAGTAGATLAFGDVVYLAAADSRWELADADSATTSGNVLVGIVVLAAAADGDPTVILLSGNIRADTAFPAFTISAPVYISATAGDATNTAPSTTGQIVRRLGFALTADSMIWNPSNDSGTAP